MPLRWPPTGQELAAKDSGAGVAGRRWHGTSERRPDAAPRGTMSTKDSHGPDSSGDGEPCPLFQELAPVHVLRQARLHRHAALPLSRRWGRAVGFIVRRPADPQDLVGPAIGRIEELDGQLLERDIARGAEGREGGEQRQLDLT